MRTINEIKSELKKQSHELAKHQHTIDVIAKTEHDKQKAQIQCIVTSKIIESLKWVLNEPL